MHRRPRPLTRACHLRAISRCSAAHVLPTSGGPERDARPGRLLQLSGGRPPVTGHQLVQRRYTATRQSWVLLRQPATLKTAISSVINLAGINLHRRVCGSPHVRCFFKFASEVNFCYDTCSLCTHCRLYTGFHFTVIFHYVRLKN